MSDLRRLEHTITRLENEWLALIFIDDTNPSRLAIDDLEIDL